VNKGEQNNQNSPPGEYVALIPAAGIGSRLPDRRLSKELLPIGQSGKPVISHMLSCLRLAGVSNLSIVLRQGKRDISDYLAGKEWEGFNIDCKTTRGTSGVPQTVAHGLRGNQNQPIVFGFPDILFKPENAFTTLLQRFEKTNADVVLGLFPTDTPWKMDLAKCDDSGRVLGIEIKPEQSELDLCWILAVWTPAFSQYLLDLVLDDATRITAMAASSDDNHLGQVFKLAIDDGLVIDSVSFSEGRSLDIGTPDDLEAARAWTN
jgi:glucose-1-phosphate thymidylyltransferase